MLTEHFTKILDHFTEWTFGVHHNQSKPGKKLGRPHKDDSPDAGIPINAHPVVIEHKPLAYPCEWCNNICTKQKLYTRSIKSNVWNAKCGDCGEKRNILTGQLISDK